MAFPSPPPAPQRGDRTTFSGRVDAFLTWLTNLVPQMNTFLSSLTTLAAGGANAFAYTFDTSVTDSDPGNGKIRLGSATQNAANMIRLDNLAANGGDVTAFMTALQAGTSNVKASVRLQKVSDPTVYLLFDITAVAAATGYLNLTVTPRTSSATSPFAANDTLILFFDPKGDKGDGGGTPTQQQIRDAIGTLDIAHGGTGATTAAAALTNLGAAAANSVPVLGQKVTSLGTRLASGAPPAINAIDGTNNGGNVALGITNGGNTGAASVIAFEREGSFKLYFGLDTDNVLKVGFGNVSYSFWTQGNFNPANYAALSGAAFTGAISAPTVTETSDERKKTNWRPLTDAQLDALADMDLVGVFDWADGSGNAVGASAQQIRAIVPEAVHEDSDGNLSVAYGGLSFAIAQSALRRVRSQK